jgi:signal transduction histidine kinase
MHLNPHTILPILCLIFSLFCGISVLSKNVKSQLNQIFFLICLSMAGWLSFYIPFNFKYSQTTLIWWFKISHCFIAFLPIMCFTFVTTFLNIPRNTFWYRINLLIGILLSVLSLISDYIISGILYLDLWNYPYPKAGILHPLLVIHCCCLSFYSIKLILNELKNKNLSSKKINQLKYIFCAILVLSTGITDFTFNYGVTLFYPIGCLSTTLFLIILSICILKHQLMDINIAIKKGLVYSFLISFITLTYLVVVLIIERVFHNYFGYSNFTSSLITAIFIALIFIPLKNWIQDLVDRLFFKGTQIEIAYQNERLKQEITQTEKLKSIAILASGLAHEIKNPLTVLKTFGEFLPSKMDDKEFLTKFSPLINKEINRINTLLQELLSFSKPTPVELRPLNVCPLIESTLDLISNNIAKNNINVTTSSLTDPIVLNIDENQFKQALLNILLNALDAMPTNGTLSISTLIINNNKIFQLKIQDTGCGIDPLDMPHIFDPFFTKKSLGTGLGLSVTHEIIKNHNGRIFVESKKDCGTTFIIELPYNSPLL